METKGVEKNCRYEGTISSSLFATLYFTAWQWLYIRTILLSKLCDGIATITLTYSYMTFTSCVLFVSAYLYCSSKYLFYFGNQKPHIQFTGIGYRKWKIKDFTEPRRIMQQKLVFTPRLIRQGQGLSKAGIYLSFAFLFNRTETSPSTPGNGEWCTTSHNGLGSLGGQRAFKLIKVTNVKLGLFTKVISSIFFTYSAICLNINCTRCV